MQIALVVLWVAAATAAKVCQTTVCPTDTNCVGTGVCCPFQRGDACGAEACCPQGWGCRGETCTKGEETQAAAAGLQGRPLQCGEAEVRLKQALRRVVQQGDLMSVLDVLEAGMAGKEVCAKAHTEKLEFSARNCMVSFLYLETDTRVTYWSLASGDFSAAMSALYRVLAEAPYLNADCLA